MKRQNKRQKNCLSSPILPFSTSKTKYCKEAISKTSVDFSLIDKLHDVEKGKIKFQEKEAVKATTCTIFFFYSTL